MSLYAFLFLFPKLVILAIAPVILAIAPVILARIT